MDFPTIIETERLVLKKLNLEHYSDEYLEWLKDKEVNQFTFVSEGYTSKDLRDYLAGVEKANIMFYAIHIKKTLQHIGNVKIDPIDFIHGFGEYGILIGDKSTWGKGYGKEASEVAIQYAFNVLNLRKVNLHVSSKNIRAINLYYKMGFVLEGILKQHFKYKYGYDDVLIMSIYNNGHK